MLRFTILKICCSCSVPRPTLSGPYLGATQRRTAVYPAPATGGTWLSSLMCKLSEMCSQARTFSTHSKEAQHNTALTVPKASHTRSVSHLPLISHTATGGNRMHSANIPTSRNVMAIGRGLGTLVCLQVTNWPLSAKETLWGCSQVPHSWASASTSAKEQHSCLHSRMHCPTSRPRPTKQSEHAKFHPGRIAHTHTHSRAAVGSPCARSRHPPDAPKTLPATRDGKARLQQE